MRGSVGTSTYIERPKYPSIKFIRKNGKKGKYIGFFCVRCRKCQPAGTWVTYDSSGQFICAWHRAKWKHFKGVIVTPAEPGSSHVKGRKRSRNIKNRTFREAREEVLKKNHA
jgi:hypothetical protein